MRERMVLVAPPGLIAQRARARVADERSWPVVAYPKAVMRGPWTIIGERRTIEVVPRPVLRLSNLLMVRDAVLEGAGAALLPTLMVNDAIAAGRLRSIGFLEGVDVDVAVVHPSRRLVSRRLRAFIDLLLRSFPSTGRVPRSSARR
jgi:DNA-binding transcriptional LysR family regulator